MYAGENFLRVACDPKTPLKKLPVVLDTYELMIFVVFRFEESFFYKYRGSCVHLAEGFNSTRMVIMSMTDDECLDVRDIDPKRLGILQKPVALPRIKENAMASVLDVARPKA